LTSHQTDSLLVIDQDTASITSQPGGRSWTESGVQWNVGPADATQRVTGTGTDFCLLVTRRRHRDDTALTATGDEADRWLDIAQIYRGPQDPGAGPGSSRARRPQCPDLYYDDSGPPSCAAGTGHALGAESGYSWSSPTQGPRPPAGQVVAWVVAFSTPTVGL